MSELPLHVTTMLQTVESMADPLPGYSRNPFVVLRCVGTGAPLS